MLLTELLTAIVALPLVCELAEKWSGLVAVSHGSEVIADCVSSGCSSEP